MVKQLLAITALLCVALGHSDEKYRVVNSWKVLDFDYGSQEARARAIRSRDFVPGNAVPIDVDIWHHGGETRTFVTIPRFKEGIPASLVTVTAGQQSSPLLKPFPDWPTHKLGNCDGLTSVFRTQIDRCGRLWAIDSGMVDLNILPRRRLCQPKLAVYDLQQSRLVKTFKFPSRLLTDISLLITVALDTRSSPSCEHTFAYVADVQGNQLLVLDVRRGAVWRVQSNSMYPEPIRGLFRTNGVEFDLMDGIMGLALPQTEDPDLFYHAFASLRESFVPTSVLRNESLFETGFNMAPRMFRTTEEVRPSQATAEAFDTSGILYFAPVAENAIYCWNSNLPYTKQNLVRLVHDDTDLQFATGLKVRQRSNGDEDLYLLTSRLHLSMVNKLRNDEVNFRIIKAPIRQLTQGTGCFNTRKPGGTISFPSSGDKPTSYGYFSG